MAACSSACGFAVTGVVQNACCRLCAAKPGSHGPRCAKKPVDPAAGGSRGAGGPAAPTAPDGQADCAGACGYVVTGSHPTHCCHGCGAAGQHGPWCHRTRRDGRSDAGTRVALRSAGGGELFGPFEMVALEGGKTAFFRMEGAALVKQVHPTLRVPGAGAGVADGRGGAGKFAQFQVVPAPDGKVRLRVEAAAAFLTVRTCALASTDAADDPAALWTVVPVAHLPREAAESLHALWAAFPGSRRVPMAASEKQQFRDDGFLQLKGVVPQALVDNALRHINERILQEGAVTAVNDRVAFCHDMVGHDAITALMHRTPLFGLCEDLLGKGMVQDVRAGQIALRAPSSHLVATPGVPLPTPWHVDGLENGAHSSFDLLVGVTLSATPKVNSGNFVVWPGSHHACAAALKRLTQAGKPVMDLMDQKEGTARPDVGKGVHVTAEAGDVVLAHHKLAHSGGPNAGCDIRYQIYFRLKHKNHEHNSSTGLTLENVWVSFDGLRG